jgi:DNA invertase Pin-like site-specific DNA recombinase
MYMYAYVNTDRQDLVHLLRRERREDLHVPEGLEVAHVGEEGGGPRQEVRPGIVAHCVYVDW